MHSGKGKSIAALILLAAMLLTLLPAGAVTAAPEDGAIDIKIYYSQKDINTTIAGRTIPAMVSDEQLEVSGDESFSALITPAAPTTVSSRNADERIAAYRLEPGTYFWRTFRTDGETKIQTAAGVFEVTADNATNDYYLCPIHITTANVGDTGDYHSKVRLFDLLSREVEPIWMADAGNRDMSTGETVYTGYYLCRQNGQKFSFRLEPENPDYADMDYEEVLSTGLPNALQMYRSVPVVKAGLKLKEITVKVTAGGPLLFFRKTGAHYTPFKIYPQELVASNQDGYDIYKVKLAQEAGFIAGGGDSPYVKTGGPLYYIITSPTGQTVSSLVINLQTPDEVMRTYENPYNNNLYLNINNARYLVKGADNDFNLVPLRAWQGLMYGETMANGFINPDFHAEVLNLGGADLTAVSDANPGRDSFTLASAAPGLSLVRVTYDPLQWYTYGDMQSPFIIPPNGEIVTPAWTDVYYPGIDPVHTGLFIVNTVADPAAANPANLQTNITAEEVGAYYFDQDLTDHAEYTFTPTADAGEISVRVHDPLHGASDLAAAWADEAQWTDYSPEADGAFTVNLKEGRNIVEVATSAQEFKQYYVVNAKGVTVNIANLGKPDWQKGENLSLGDTVQIVFTGVESAPTKLAGIYNPQRMDSVYDTSWGTTVRGWGSGYDVGDANYLSLTPGETGELRLFNGVLYSEGYGGTSGLHHSIGPEGFKPNLSAASVAGDYSTLPDITLFIEDGIFVAERRRDEYALLSNIYSSINGSSTNTLPLPGQAHYRNLDVPICRSVDGSEYSSTAVHLYGIKEGRVYIRNWLGSAPDDIVFARFLSHSEMTNNNALTGLSGPRRAEWDSGGDVEYAELVLAPAEDLGNPLTYTFRLITEEDYGRYPYIQDLRLNLDSRSDINYYSGRLLAVDENGDPATVDTAPESTNADSDDEKPVLSLGYGFLATRSSYISHVPYNVGSVTLSVHPFTEPNGQTTEVTVNGEPVVDEVSRPIPLSGEETVITVVGTAAAVDPVTNEKNSVEYTLKVLRDPAPVNFTVATVEGGRLSIRKPSGVRVIPNEDGTYPLPVTSGYSYIYERPGYVTVTGTFEVTAAMTAGTEITLAAPSVPVNQAAGQARVTVIAADETLFRDAAVSFDPATAPDLAGRGYLPYNPGGYTVLNALVDALESDHSLFVGLGGAGVDFTVTPVEGVLEEVAGVTLAEGESWICELGGAVIDDYAHTLVPPGADIVLYRSSGAADETLLRLTPGESSVPRGESVALTLTGRVGAGGPAAAVAGAAILIDRQPTDYVTDDAGQVTIDTSRLSLNYHTIEAALPDVPILNTSATIRVTKPADAAVTNTVSLRLIGAEPPEQEGYGPWFDYRNWIATDEYELTGESVTAADVFRAVTVRHGLETDIRFEGNYISAIQAPEEFGGEYLAESDAGGYSGWMYTVNGEYTDYGIAEQTVSPGDELVFHYSADPLREFNRHWLYVEDVNPSAYRPPVPEAGTVEETLTPAVAITATESGAPAAAVTVAAGDVQAAVTEALAKAAAEEARGETATTAVKIEVAIPGDSGLRPEEVAEVYVTLPAEAVEILTGQDGGGGVDSLKIESALGEIELERAALSAAYSGDGLSLVLSRLTTETAAAEELQPPENTDVQIYEVRLYGVTDDTQVTSFGNGRVKISLPYDLPAGETIVVWHVQPGIPAGDGDRVADAFYDPTGRRAVFTAAHFSYYAVGYTTAVEPEEPPVPPEEPPVPPEEPPVVPKRPTPSGGSGLTVAYDPQTPAVTVTRESLSYISGADRVLTSVAISRQGWTSADTVVLAPGGANNLIDALAVAPLAGQEDAPILLSVGGLDPAVVAEIERLGAKRVYAVGALSETVIEALKTALPTLTVETLRGASRFETAALINAKVENPKGTFIVGYNAVADAVSVASYAAAHGYLIQIAQPDGTLATDHYPLPTDHYILGGPALVGDIPGATRLYGATRYETNKAVREALTFEYTNIYTADGATLVDALTGSALAAKTKAAIVLVPGNDPAGVDFGGITAETRVYAFGG